MGFSRGYFDPSYNIELTSPRLNLTETSCFKFYYLGNDVSLRVHGLINGNNYQYLDNNFVYPYAWRAGHVKTYTLIKWHILQITTFIDL